MSRAARRGRIGGYLGVASLALLAASIRWAHHWGPQADSIVAAWALSTAGALWISKASVRASRSEYEPVPRLACLGIWLAVVSLLALVVAGIAAAAGADPAGACGGG